MDLQRPEAGNLVVGHLVEGLGGVQSDLAALAVAAGLEPNLVNNPFMQQVSWFELRGSRLLAFVHDYDAECTKRLNKTVTIFNTRKNLTAGTYVKLIDFAVTPTEVRGVLVGRTHKGIPARVGKERADFRNLIGISKDANNRRSTPLVTYPANDVNELFTKIYQNKELLFGSYYKLGDLVVARAHQDDPLLHEM